MNMQKNTKADKAYQSGKQTALAGGSLKDNPYIISSMKHISNWWVKGFNENLAK